MKQNGQATILYAIILLLVLGAVFMLITTALPGMKTGADTIANAVTEPEFDLAVMWKVNGQTLTPNQHAVGTHGGDAWQATDCYNRNGTFQIYRVGDNEFHLLCSETDNTVRDVIIKQRSKGSKEFDMVNSFTPKNGILKDIMYWLRGKGAQSARLPNDITIYIDGIAP